MVSFRGLQIPDPEDASRLEPGNTTEIFLQAAADLGNPPTVVADSGVENVNSKVDELVESGTLKRLLARTELVVRQGARWRISYDAALSGIEFQETFDTLDGAI